MTTPTLLDELAIAPAVATRTINVLALDFSLTATGAAGNARGGWTATIKPPVKLRGHERLAHIRGEILDRHLLGIDVLAVEGPSYGSQGGQGHHEAAGLWWLVTHYAWAAGIPIVVIAPTSLKKYLAGKGNAKKDDMVRQATRAFPWFNGGNDEADAIGLAAMTADHYGAPLIAVPAVNRTALDAVQWPDLRAGVS